MHTLSPRRRPSADGRALTVEAGQVVCPRRGLVDLEVCWVCPAYRGLSTGHFEGVLCSTGASLMSTVGSWLPTVAGDTKR
ncbi:MAG TPA: hypothetical protein VFI69_08520 [Candidatus Limnocylindrales bacterium]|jgi:hypothetical protein|nr:hypothetical protein [Candidatus Limnocylindrales bacterium]